MRQIDWYGNNGYSNPAPGTVETVNCGVCNTQMDVERGVFRPSSFAEASAGKSHLHDSFICPYVGEEWHKRIYRLKIGVYLAEIEIDGLADYEEKKKAAEKEIIEILKANMGQ